MLNKLNEMKLSAPKKCTINYYHFPPCSKLHACHWGIDCYPRLPWNQRCCHVYSMSEVIPVTPGFQDFAFYTIVTSILDASKLKSKLWLEDQIRRHAKDFGILNRLEIGSASVLICISSQLYCRKAIILWGKSEDFSIGNLVCEVHLSIRTVTSLFRDTCTINA